MKIEIEVDNEAINEGFKLVGIRKPVEGDWIMWLGTPTIVKYDPKVHDNVFRLIYEKTPAWRPATPQDAVNKAKCRMRDTLQHQWDYGTLQGFIHEPNAIWFCENPMRRGSWYSHCEVEE